jgi:hypothetical protein
MWGICLLLRLYINVLYKRITKKVFIKYNVFLYLKENKNTTSYLLGVQTHPQIYLAFSDDPFVDIIVC